jgi:predicted Zn-dependent peptidase
LLLESLMGAAFIAHPYGVRMGWASDTENLRVGDADEFHRTYYVPGNITIAIAGDVDPKQARALAEKYYGRLPAGPMPPPVITVEPEQAGERRVEVETPSQPMIAVGYKRPNRNHPDDAVFDVISGILASGRTGILYKELVRDKKTALAAASIASFPGNKFPTLFLLYGYPNMGKTVQEVEEAMYEIIDRLKKEKVDEETLQRVKTKVRAGVIRSLDSNSGLASSLVSYHQAYGDWRILFKQIDIINEVTADDVQRVVREYFTKKNRTVAYHVKPEANQPAEENAE